MRLPFLLSLLFAARAGVHDVPPEARRERRGRAHGRGVGVGIAAWKRRAAQTRLARLDLIHDARGVITEDGSDIVEVADPDAVIELRHVRNAAKRRRRAIRAQGGQA